MSNPVYTIRNYRSEDFDRLVRLAAEVEKLGQTWCYASLWDLRESLGQPSFSENNLFIADIAGDIVGYIMVAPELDIGRVVLNCLIHPKYRREGWTTKLFDCAIQRARELGAKMAHVNIPQDNITAKKLLTRMGFKFVRRFLELELDLSKTHLPDISQIARQCRHLKHGEENKLTQIQNRSFTDTWGYNPNTVAEIIYRTSLPHCSPEDIILTCDADKPIGYCWTRIKSGENTIISGDKGYIYMLGVDPDYRGRGTGKKVLLAGLAYLKSKGRQVIELTVDSENRAACALYRSAGFKLRTSSLWYEKVLG